MDKKYPQNMLDCTVHSDHESVRPRGFNLVKITYLQNLYPSKISRYTLTVTRSVSIKETCYISKMSQR